MPATRALERAKHTLSQAPSSLVAPKADAVLPRHESMITKNSLKRSRSTMGSFKLDDLFEATAPVEESIAFPSIEWNFDHDEEDESGNSSECSNNNDFPSIDFPSIGFPSGLGRTRTLPTLESVLERDEDDDDDDDCCHRTKRVCRGLVRSRKIETNMASLTDLLSGT